MLPPKDAMNEELNNRYKKREEMEPAETTEDMLEERVEFQGFGPPNLNTETGQPSFYNPQEIQNAYANFNDDNSDIDEEEMEYEPMLEEEYDDEEMFEMPTPPSFRQPGASLLKDEALFPGGPAKSEISAWKKQFEADNHTVHLSELDEDHIFIWRTLSRSEYREIMALPNVDPLQREEIICEVCVLFPMNYNFTTMASRKAGIPAQIAEQIMHESGFKKPSPPIRL